MNLEDFKIYLPKYLSTASEKELFSSLNDFPNNIDQRIYTTFLKSEKIIFQGDGLSDLLAIELPKVETKQVQAIVLSNTCDLYSENKRNFQSQIIYAPLISFKKYKEILLRELSKSPEQVESHLKAIKKQSITQIFYLPSNSQIEESIVFLDRVYNIDNEYIDRSNLNKTRLFTLSDYGIYLFLFKLSLHFTRIQDQVERKSTS